MRQHDRMDGRRVDRQVVQFRSRSDFKPWNRPQSTSSRVSSVSSRYFEPGDGLGGAEERESRHPVTIADAKPSGSAVVRSRSAKLKTPHVVPVPSPHHSLLDALRGPDARDRGGTASAARGADGSRGHERLDRHLPRRAAAVEERHVRVPDRQRRRHRRGRQPPASRHEPRHRRAARADRPVPHVQASARLLRGVRGARLAARVPGARRARRRPHARRAALGRARVAAAAD